MSLRTVCFLVPLLVAFAICELALAANRLELVLRSSSPKSREAWRHACPLFGGELTARGVRGASVFESYSCVLGGAKPDNTTARPDWRLVVNLSKKHTRFSLYRLTVSVPYADLTLPASSQALRALDNDAFRQALAFYFLDHLPFFGRCEIDDKGKVRIGDQPLRPDIPSPPDSLFIFKGEWRANLWIAEDVATATKAKDNASVWLMDKDREQGAYWLHSSQGPGVYAEALKPQIEQLYRQEGMTGIERFVETALGSFNYALLSDRLYVGIRFGLPILTGDYFTSDMRFFGMLFDVRGGPMSGFSLHLDIWPEVTAKSAEGVSQFSGNRVILGYSLKFPLLQLATFNIIPKVGVWSMKSRIPVLTNQGYKPARFDVQRATSLGLETGLERRVAFALFRLWVSHDFGVSFRKDESSAFARRAGADMWYDMPGKTFGTKSLLTSWLLFAFVEEFDLEKNSEVAAGDLKKLSILQAYTGGGVALSW